MEWMQAETRDQYNIQGSDLVIDFRQVPQPSKQPHSWNLSSLSLWGTSQILTITSGLCSPTTHGPLTNVKRHSSQTGVQSLESRNTLQASKVSTEIQGNRLATSPIKLKKKKKKVSYRFPVYSWRRIIIRIPKRRNWAKQGRSRKTQNHKREGETVKLSFIPGTWNTRWHHLGASRLRQLRLL